MIRLSKPYFKLYMLEAKSAVAVQGWSAGGTRATEELDIPSSGVKQNELLGLGKDHSEWRTLKTSPASSTKMSLKVKYEKHWGLGLVTAYLKHVPTFSLEVDALFFQITFATQGLQVNADQ